MKEFLNSYLIAIISGLIVYIALYIDGKYIEPVEKENISIRIPLLVSLIVWIVCTFFTKPLVGGGTSNISQMSFITMLGGGKKGGSPIPAPVSAPAPAPAPVPTLTGTGLPPTPYLS